MTKSAYVSSCRAPTLKSLVENGFIKFNDDRVRVVRKGVPTESFYESGEGRYDTVLVSRGMQGSSLKNSGSSRKILVWLVKALDFRRAALNASENGLCPSRKKLLCKACL